MVFNSKSSVSEEQNERHKRLLAAMLKDPGNKQCCDCGVRNPTWWVAGNTIGACGWSSCTDCLMPLFAPRRASVNLVRPETVLAVVLLYF